MQVTHAADHITHAMIGGALPTIEFKVSSDAALMHMLSTALYSDQRLAVAREVLCNAWDAHIRAGVEDLPIIVTITDAKVVVRDFGAGIAPDMMGPLYGTYGGTDKLNNGTETGGFGLGCKAPFSYNEHFEVVSWHAGVKTIYNCSKSSADRMGKPGITPIVQLPTTETGLQVSIPLKGYNDKGIFNNLFRNVARNGEMNVVLNDDKVEGLPISKAAKNWLITNIRPLNGNHRVYVRYGNVIYPVESRPEYGSLYRNLESFLDTLSVRNYNSSYCIIFQAEPDTISVTPSRESLSMQEHTIGTLKELFTGFFMKDFDAQVAKESWLLLDEQILDVTAKKLVGELMTDKKELPGLATKANGQDLINIGNIAQLAEQYTRKTYPKDPEFYRRDMGLRVEMAMELGVGRRGHLHEVKRQASTNPKKLGQRKTSISGVDRKPYFYREQDNAHEWFKRKIVRPLIRDIEAHKMLELKRFSILQGRTRYSDDLNFVEPMRYRHATFAGYLPILRNILVISHSRKKETEDRIKRNPVIKGMGQADQIWFYHAPVAATRIQPTRDFFEAKGFIIIDLTEPVRAEWDLPKPDKTYIPVAQRVVKPKLAGFAALKGCIVITKPTRVDNCFLDDAPRLTTDPKFYHYVSFSKADHREWSLGNFDAVNSYKIVTLFGNDCAIVRTDPQRKKLKEAGLMELNEYVMTYVCKTVTTSPSFLAYWEEDICRSLGNKDGCALDKYGQHELLSALLDTPEIRTILGLKTVLNEHDLMVLHLWRTMTGNHRRYASHDVGKMTLIPDAQKVITGLPVSKTITDITMKLAGNQLIELLDLNRFQRITRNAKSQTNGDFDRVAQIVKIALLG